jgi:lysophospholipase L1-like esterase
LGGDVQAKALSCRSLESQRGRQPMAVVNLGVGGNRIIPGDGNGSPTLQRLNRDVLVRAGATHVLFLQGMNDLGGGASSDQLTAAIRQVIDRVHAKVCRLSEGRCFRSRPDRAQWTQQMEANRLAVNSWIRTQAPYDGVIDFDRLMSGGPLYDGRQSLKSEFACDDDVHPNARGYEAMGQFVDLELFRRN